MKFFLVFFLSLFSLNADIVFTSVTKRKTPTEMTTSVIIPCVAKHFKHLSKLLTAYENQTYLPDQIVISLSEIEQLEENEIAALANYPWAFRLSVLRQFGKKSAGQNRNLACKEADGMLILCQDADDLPHPQRVEIVKYLFEHYIIDHLLHGWIPEGKSFIPYVKELVQIKKFDAYWDAINSSTLDLQNGQICLLKEVANTVQWNDSFGPGEDLEFNQHVYSHFENTVVAYAALCLYRNSLSSFLPNN
jgi:hypothetical protein